MSEAESTIHETTNGAAPRAKRKANNQPIHAQVVDHVAIRREATKALVAERTYHRKRDAEITEELGDGSVLADVAQLRGLQDIVVPTVVTLGSAHGARRGNLPAMNVDTDGVVTRTTKVRAAGTKNGDKSAPKTNKAPRLARRSSEDIESALASIVTLLGKNPAGLKAEVIRKELGIDKRSLPRVLKQGIETGTIRSSGQKRATIYQAVDA